MPKITFIAPDGTRRDVEAPEGLSVMEIAHRNKVDIEGACEGSLACSTCHVIVASDWYDKLPEASDDEEDMLDLAFGLTPTSRLCCQIIMCKELDGLVVTQPAATRNMMVDKRKMKWSDTIDIAIALEEAHADVDNVNLRFTDLHAWVCALPGFSDDPAKSNEKSWKPSRWPGSTSDNPLPREGEGNLGSRMTFDLPPRSRVVVAMSGGVDSSATAALLAEAGHEVVGVTLRLYDEGDAGLLCRQGYRRRPRRRRRFGNRRIMSSTWKTPSAPR